MKIDRRAKKELATMLRDRGYSNRAIRKILEWYLPEEAMGRVEEEASHVAR